QKSIVDLISAELDKGRSAKDILNESLLPAINDVGELFDRKKYFLPQLISSGETMKTGITRIEPLLQEDRDPGEEMPTIVIATVEGDKHDIGKNLVILMLKNYGFHVVDLGKDVPAKVIIDAAKEYNADIVALSALMTSTMRKMEEVIELGKAEGLKCCYMIGGAVITPDYADEIHAQYSSDAADAVKVAKRILGIRM
nr:cobalamin-dependent protein [Lachnospiraceae bacterium]